jgi:hypothetical protein
LSDSSAVRSPVIERPLQKNQLRTGAFFVFGAFSKKSLSFKSFGFFENLAMQIP